VSREHEQWCTRLGTAARSHTLCVLSVAWARPWDRRAPAMTEGFRRARLFLGSYVLLFVLLAVRFQTVWLEIACGVLAGVGFLDMVRIVFWISKRTGEDPIRLTQVIDAGPDVAGYMATYLLPFLTVSQPTIRDVVAYAIFLLVTGLVYVRSEMAQINPTLYLLGRRVLAVTTDGGWSGHLVARSVLRPDDEILAVPLNSAVRVEVSARTWNK
jgi:hypothetical protein